MLIWGQGMDMIEPEDILRISSDGVPAFIRDRAHARSLSPLIQKLNNDLMGADPLASELAARALKHLGFSDRV